MLSAEDIRNLVIGGKATMGILERKGRKNDGEWVVKI